MSQAATRNCDSSPVGEGQSMGLAASKVCPLGKPLGFDENLSFRQFPLLINDLSQVLGCPWK